MIISFVIFSVNAVKFLFKYCSYANKTIKIVYDGRRFATVKFKIYLTSKFDFRVMIIYNIFYNHTNQKNYDSIVNKTIT